MHRRARIASRIGGFVIALAAGAAVGSSAKWFDGLTPLQLFLVVGGGLAIIIFAIEQFYRYEYSRDTLSAEHLDGLKATATELAGRVQQRTGTETMEQKDLRDLYSHRRDIKKLSEKWSDAVQAVFIAQSAFETELSGLLDDQGFFEDRFNRFGLQIAFLAVTRDRKEWELGGVTQPPMRWDVWKIEPTTTPWGMRNNLYYGTGTGTLFIRDIDDTANPLDIDECKKGLQDAYEAAERSPWLKEWVQLEQGLRRDQWVAEFMDLLHDFGRRDHVRRGRGCAQCG